MAKANNMNQPPKDQRLQFIRVDRGISQFNNDYYAALGLPIIIRPSCIRQVYLSIARILHPDIYGFSTEDKEIATEYLAKLVNPAYDILMKEQERQAYQGIFKLLAKRLMQKSRNIQIHAPIACELMLNPSDGAYERAVSAIAYKQYQSLDNILDCTAQISELNLVYILYKEGYQYGAANMPPVIAPMALTKISNSPVTPNYSYAASTKYLTYQPSINCQKEANETIIQTKVEINDIKTISDRLKICEIYLSKSDWKGALKELREIQQLDKDNSKCLAMLGVVYKNINQLQMAKASLQRSLQINPQEPLALKHIKDLRNPNPIQPSSPVKNIKNSDPKLNTATTKKTLVSEPKKRGWIANLLGWAFSGESK